MNHSLFFLCLAESILNGICTLMRVKGSCLSSQHGSSIFDETLRNSNVSKYSSKASDALPKLPLSYKKTFLGRTTGTRGQGQTMRADTHLWFLIPGIGNSSRINPGEFAKKRSRVLLVEEAIRVGFSTN